MDDQKLKWQPLTMIPVLNEIVEDMLKASERQLLRLEEAKNIMRVFDRTARSRIVQFHMDQNTLVPTYLEQCKLWRNYLLNHTQKNWINNIERNAQLLKTANEKILSLLHKQNDSVACKEEMLVK